MMSPLFDTLLLSWDQLITADGRLFKGDPGEVGLHAINHGSNLHFEDIMVIFGALLVLLSGLSLVNWLRQQRIRPHRLVVFNRVAREAGLNWGDRVLLWRIGQTLGLPTPLTLMLCPGTLGHCGRQFVHPQSRGRAALNLARAASIRRHLFGPDA
ncbi:MAG: hypothetical protein AAGA25_01180 [Planctomycetota bacterium]